MVKYPILVLDIDETCAHTSQDNNIWDNSNIRTDPKKIDIRDRVYTLNVPTDRLNGHEAFMWGVKRPYLDEFLIFAFTYFKLVIVWSAGLYEYVHDIVPKLFINTYEPHFILTRDNCVFKNGVYEKPFWKMLKDLPQLEPYMDLDIDNNGNIKGFKNVVLVDDRPYSFNSNPYNGILIPSYEPILNTIGIKLPDYAFIQLIKFLKSKEVTGSNDVRKIDKKHIFSSTPPTDSSSHEMKAPYVV